MLERRNEFSQIVRGVYRLGNYFSSFFPFCWLKIILCYIIKAFGDFKQVLNHCIDFKARSGGGPVTPKGDYTNEK
jgi:hypothetical protein